MIRDDVTVYFIRHGQTDWNAARRYQGQRDIPLNDLGRAQARRNGAALMALGATLAGAEYVSSPLGRARETMEIMRAAMGLAPSEYRVDEAIKEIHYGHWEGLLAEDMPRLDPQGLAARRRDPYRWRPDGGESYADLALRIGRWLGTVERDCVVTSHGGVMRTLQGLVTGLSPAEILSIDAPQDRIMVIRRGAVDWI